MRRGRHSSSVAGFPEGSAGEGPTCDAGDAEDVGFDPRVGKIPWRKKWQPAPVFLPGGSRGRKSLVAELQTAERLSTQHPEVSAQLTPGRRQRRGPGDRGRSVSLAGRWTSWETAGACKRWVTPIGCAQGLHLDKHMWCVPSQRASCRALAHLLRPRG